MTGAVGTTAAEQPVETPWHWFGSLLAKELAPFPGRGWTVARMTIAATIVMLCIMVFRLPNAALGAYYTLLFSRDSARATLISTTRSVLAAGVSLLYITVTVRLVAGEPFLHFMWVAGTLFITFFLISALSEYLAGTAFGFLAVTSISAWDFPANTDVLFANTLWTALAVLLGAVVTTAVELIARNIHPTDELTERLLDRIRVVEETLRSFADHRPIDTSIREKLEQYAMVGTAPLRRLLLNSSHGAQITAEMSATVALVGRIIDLTGHVIVAHETIPPDQTQGFRQVADRLAEIRTALARKDTQALASLRTNCDDGPPDSLLSDIQTTIKRVPEVFSGIESLTAYTPSAADFNQPKPLFKDDAFSNVEHIHFALKGTLAALSCYFVYNAVDWRGLSSSVATCMITALSTVGSSRQKQILRVAGAVIGGFGFGMTAQIFLLPYMDGIGDFTVLFAVVTAISAWIATASPRISYAGAQTGFAFYVTQLRVFGPQTSLVVARDDALGILFGLLAMWVTFDRLWVKDTPADMLDRFVANMRRIAGFDEQMNNLALPAAIDRARRERALINANFDQIRNLADSLIFEFGEGWQQKIALRDLIRQWQPQLRTYFLLQVALAHYRFQAPNLQLEPEARSNVRQSSLILSLLADLVDPRKRGEAEDTQRRLEEEGSRAEREGANETDSHRTRPVQISQSMLGVAVSLAREMERKTQSRRIGDVQGSPAEAPRISSSV